MMLSRTGLYALQALLYLANRSTNGPVPAATMAEALGIPSNYLAKILQRLTKEEILSATRGAGGGYRLVADPGRLTVAAAVGPFQDLRTSNTCLMGGECDRSNPCAAHALRSSWNTAALAGLEQTTLSDLLAGVPSELPNSEVPAPTMETE